MIDFEEIIKNCNVVKVANHHLEIDILQWQKNNFSVTGANFYLNYLSYF